MQSLRIRARVTTLVLFAMVTTQVVPAPLVWVPWGAHEVYAQEKAAGIVFSTEVDVPGSFIADKNVRTYGIQEIRFLDIKGNVWRYTPPEGISLSYINSYGVPDGENPYTYTGKPGWQQEYRWFESPAKSTPMSPENFWSYIENNAIKVEGQEMLNILQSPSFRKELQTLRTNLIAKKAKLAQKVGSWWGRLWNQGALNTAVQDLAIVEGLQNTALSPLVQNAVRELGVWNSRAPTTPQNPSARSDAYHSIQALLTTVEQAVKEGPASVAALVPDDVVRAAKQHATFFEIFAQLNEYQRRFNLASERFAVGEITDARIGMQGLVGKLADSSLEAAAKQAGEHGRLLELRQRSITLFQRILDAPESESFWNISYEISNEVRAAEAAMRQGNVGAAQGHLMAADMLDRSMQGPPLESNDPARRQKLKAAIDALRVQIAAKEPSSFASQAAQRLGDKLRAQRGGSAPSWFEKYGRSRHASQLPALRAEIAKALKGDAVKGTALFMGLTFALEIAKNAVLTGSLEEGYYKTGVEYYYHGPIVAGMLVGVPVGLWGAEKVGEYLVVKEATKKAGTLLLGGVGAVGAVLSVVGTVAVAWQAVDLIDTVVVKGEQRERLSLLQAWQNTSQGKAILAGLQKEVVQELQEQGQKSPILGDNPWTQQALYYIFVYNVDRPASWLKETLERPALKSLQGKEEYPGHRRYQYVAHYLLTGNWKSEFQVVAERYRQEIMRDAREQWRMGMRDLAQKTVQQSACQAYADGVLLDQLLAKESLVEDSNFASALPQGLADVSVVGILLTPDNEGAYNPTRFLRRVLRSFSDVLLQGKPVIAYEAAQRVCQGSQDALLQAPKPLQCGTQVQDFLGLSSQEQEEFIERLAKSGREEALQQFAVCASGNSAMELLLKGVGL